jgi:hypothetical protein
MSALSLSQGGNRWLAALRNAKNESHVPLSQPEDANLGAVCAKATEMLMQASCDGRLPTALADAQKNHVEMARSRLAKLFSEASFDGRLSAAINEVQASQHVIVESVESPPEISGRDKARSNLARTLADASADGRLYAALTEVQADTPEAPESYREEEEEEMEAEETEDIEEIRSHALGMLTRAAYDGSLFDALSEVHAQQPEMELAGKVQEPDCTSWQTDDIRLKARRLLTKATDDGSFSKALTEASKPKVKDIETLRAHTRKLLTNATDNGSLFKALVEVKGSPPQVAASRDIDQARTSLAQLLAAASADGRLFAALREVHTPEEDLLQEEEHVKESDDGTVSTDATESTERIPSECAPRCGATHIDGLRSTLSNLLSQAASDGRLFAALSEVQAQGMKAHATDEFLDNEVHVQSSSGEFEPEAESSQEEDIEDIRLHTLAIFTKATEDGSLANILDEVKAQARQSPCKTETAQSWRGACVLQSEDCAHRVRDALRHGNSSPHEIEVAKLKLRNALADAMSDGTFHNALMEARSGTTAPTLTAAPESSRAAPRPPTAKRETGVSRPCSLAMSLHTAPQVVEDVSATPAMNVGVAKHVGPSLPVGPAGRAFRRRPRTNNVSAMPAVCVDIGEVVENTDGRDSSLARGYDALGAQLFSISDGPVTPRPPSSLAGNLNRCGRQIRSKSRGSNSAMNATSPNALDHAAVSAMELDLGDSVKPVVEFGLWQPTAPQTPPLQKFRSTSVGGARFGKKQVLESLPAIKPKATGRRLAHSVTNCRANDSLSWTLGVSRRNLDSIGAVF